MGGSGAGEGSLPHGIDTDLGPQGVSSPTTRPQTPRSRLPNGHEAPQSGRISRPAVGGQDRTGPPLFPAVGVPREGRKRFPRNFPRLERCGGLSRASVCNLYKLVTKYPSFPLQIGQHPVTVLLFIGLLSRINIGGAVAQQAID